MTVAAGEPGAHDYIEKMDLNGNGVPDHLEPGGGAVNDDDQEMVDRNRNGVPDHLEPGGGAANDDNFLEFGPNVHRNDPLDRSSREASGVVAATFDPDETAQDIGSRIDKANAEAAKVIEETEANPNKTRFGRDEVGTRLAKLRKKRLPKTSVAKELSRLQSAKEDTENGLAVGKAVFRGVLQAMLANKEEAQRRKNMELDTEIRETEQELRRQEEADRRQNAADHEARRTGNDKADESPETGSEKPNPDQNGPDQSGPSGDGGPNNGPSGNGPDSPSGDSSNSTTSEASVSEKSTDTPTTSETKAADVTGNSGLGMSVAAVNPAAGVAYAAAQAEQTQKDAGASHLRPEGKKTPANETPSGKEAVGSPKPGENSIKIDVPGRNISYAPVRPANITAKPAEHAPIPMGNPERKGRLFDQARSIPRPTAQAMSIGPRAPEPRVRALGLGSGISAFISAARAIAPREQNYEVGIRWMQSQRDSEGRGR